jgi:hypothetical protein
MAVVDILSIAPPREKTETVPLGSKELAIRGLKLTQIARIAQRYEGFRRAYFEEGVDPAIRAAAMIEAYPAIIVAGLGRDRDPNAGKIEAHVEKFPDDDLRRVAQAVLRLTNGEPAEEKPADPLPEGGAAEANAAA